MVVHNKKKAETSGPKLSQVERLEQAIDEAKAKVEAKVEKSKAGDILAFAKAEGVATRARAKANAAYDVLVEKHGMMEEEIEALDLAEVIANAPVPVPRKGKAEATTEE